MRLSRWFIILEWAVFLIAIFTFPRIEFHIFGALTLIFFVAACFQKAKEKRGLKINENNAPLD